jgi:hypothetical protein
MAEEYRQQINHVIKAIIRAPGDDWTTERLAGCLLYIIGTVLVTQPSQ